MKKLLVVAGACAICLSISAPVVTAGPGGISLLADRTSGGGIELQWTGGEPAFEIFRSDAPVSLVYPFNKIGETSSNMWTDLSDADLSFYVVTGGIKISTVADPTAFLTNIPEDVRVQAQILPDPGLDTNSVTLYRLDDQLDIVGPPLCNLLDNGDLANGDDIAGDSVFTCFASFLESVEATLFLRVEATLDAETIRSSILILNAVDDLTNAEIDLIESGQQEADTIWQTKLTELGDTLEARQAAAAEIAALPGVQAAGVSIDNVTIWIEYDSGVSGGLMLNPEGTRGSAAVVASIRQDGSPEMRAEWVGTLPAEFSRRTPPSATELGVDDNPVGNNNVLIWDAYNSQFAPFDEGPAISNLFNNAPCPEFNVTYLIDGQCDVSSVRTFTQYGTVVMITHGAVDSSGNVVFLTRESADFGGILAHTIDLVLGRLSIMGGVFAVQPSFVSGMSGSFDDGIIYNGSCQSTANNSMANAFIGKGANTYYGFSRVVNSSHAQNVATQLFTNLVQSLDNTGDSFNPVTPKTDPSAPFAVFQQVGDTMTVYDGKLKNRSFEQGVLGAWTAVGDGRVIAGLGPYLPTDGLFMGIISTGLGFTTDSGSIEQGFCLPVDATNLDFDWSFFSEEFIEWCGPEHPFDDPFVVELVTDTGTSMLLQETVDTLCSSVTPTSLFFDQSGPGCETTPDVGMGTGGQDCTVWTTGWTAQSIDVSAIAAANGGKGVTLRFRNFDEGDSIFDSAVLLDNVEIQQP